MVPVSPTEISLSQRLILKSSSLEFLFLDVFSNFASIAALLINISGYFLYFLYILFIVDTTDFSLDIYLMVVALQNHYKIEEYPVTWDERIAGEAKGGGSIKAKFRLIIQTLKCILALKKNFKLK